jgi:hypothetical protein
MEHLKIFREYSDEKFREWFGDSKIVDEKTGNPLVMYHGSPHIENIKNFETQKGYFFFTSELEEATRYTGKNTWPESGKYVRQFYVRCENPFDATKMNDVEKDGIYPILKSEGVIILTEFYDGYNLVESIWDLFGEQDENGETLESVIDNENKNFELCKYMFERHCDNYVILEMPIVQDWIKSNGYDGFYTLESGYGVNVAVYNSNQVKSATNNNGDFSPKSGNVFESSK